ncbi:MAG TPA: amidohydrolase family protein [Amycolatopsis sp.]|jgi:predicted TIM-barrel fold metal-dependent hydrolase|nr:amidohydrolase family protein [Amycolatopsis sp.]
MSGLTFFDCNAFIGQVSVPKFFPHRVTPAVLRAEYDRIGVARGLVTHVAAKEYSPSVGNDLLATELTGGSDHGFLPCLTLLPEQTGESWGPDEVIGRLRARGARGVRLFPSTAVHRYPFDPRVLGGLFEVLQDARVPVFVDFDLGRRDEADWRGLYDITDAFPDLPLVLIRPGGRSDRGLYPLLDRARQVYVETGGYWVHGGIERLCARFGAHRLLFGSGFPYWTLAGAAYHIATASVEDRQKSLIAGENLARLLEGARL